MTALGWIAAILGLLGAFLNAKQLKIGFIVWIICNIIQIFLAYQSKQFYNILLFLAYTGMCIWGYFHWSKKS